MSDRRFDQVVVPMDADGQERRARVAIKPCEPLMTSWAMLQAACEGKTKEVPIVVFQCINTVFREAALATQHNIAVGRSIFWYDKDTVKDLTGGRESWAGFYAVSYQRKFVAIVCTLIIMISVVVSCAKSDVLCVAVDLTDESLVNK